MYLRQSLNKQPAKHSFDEDSEFDLEASKMYLGKNLKLTLGSQMDHMQNSEFWLSSQQDIPKAKTRKSTWKPAEFILGKHRIWPGSQQDIPSAKTRNLTWKPEDYLKDSKSDLAAYLRRRCILTASKIYLRQRVENLIGLLARCTSDNDLDFWLVSQHASFGHVLNLTWLPPECSWSKN